ncbi:MAG: type II CRISPR RNA-guided endonuclease Cas9 [Clostridiales bacterium]|nr:MAG: type II CRISPR RNA-guided endonuclease Cas9 [Clostridiales bacterium]
MEKYYLGLDIGTNSVGWAVTDPSYRLERFHKKDMWGIRLFEQADTAADRRTKRTNRRRLQRRHQRIQLLQELFAEEMAKVDDTFFLRLNESKLHLEDKSVQEKYPLFIEKGYTDIDFYQEYPTIYHLRKDLMESDQPHDIRLVYLAIHHLLKYRGHFLIDGSLNSAKSFSTVFEQMMRSVQDGLKIDFTVSHPERVEEILRNRIMARSSKSKLLEKEFVVDPGEDDPKILKTVVKQICTFIAGNKGDLKKVFREDLDELEKTGFKFSDPGFDEEILPDLENKIPDLLNVVQAMKAVYDWSVLVDILDGEEYLSFAKVKQFDEHKHNLHQLRQVMKKYCEKKTWVDFFDDPTGKNNYAAYIGHVKKNGKKYSVKRCSEEDFYKNLKGILGNLSPNEEDAILINELKEKADAQILLPLQRSKDNGVVPHQVHQIELQVILEHAETYLPFLKQRDDKGISVSEKILKIFEFRIPYYVGPLSDRHMENGANAWIVRKEAGRIYPWNYEEKIDLEKSNEAFIRRMTNKCTYLLGEDVLPKNSLLYQKFMVLNELNNLKIRGKGISVALKQQIYEDLFCSYTKVTGKKLLTYLRAHEDSELSSEDLSGFDQNFKASLSAQLDFEKQIFKEDFKKDSVKKIAEDIIRWKTIYGDDNRMVQNMVRQQYPEVFSEEQLKKLNRLHYSGWGNFCAKFLTGIEGVHKDTGQQFTILQALWETNCNLMQLLSKQYTFQNAIEECNALNAGEIKSVDYDSLVRDLYTSPANKRAIWQTIQITEEIKKVMKGAPDKIFIEMARGEEKEKKRTQSRKDRLMELYAACESDVREWTKELDRWNERDFNSMKLYLYYTQMGRCMYTGEPIDLDALMSGNSKWDRDHIYPQSKIKDDSIDNLVLVNKTENAKKSNGLLSLEVQKKQREFWKELLEGGFISKKKYDRLTRNSDFSEEELAGFISRQLVETRQSSKAVAELLKRIYPDSQIVYVKASLASQFRKNNLHMLKSRRVNDYHHAKDAYLNIVVGDVYDAKFTSNPIAWMKKNYKSNYSINRVFDYDVYRGTELVWKAIDKDAKKQGSIEIVRKTMLQNNILYTEYTYCGKGQLFNETIAKKGTGASIALKKGLDPEKYGGYTSPNTAYFAFVEFDGKKGQRVKQILEIPVYVANRIPEDKNILIEYFENVKGLKNVKILREKIKKNALISVDGFPMRIRGANDITLQFKGNIQLLLEYEEEEIIRKIEKFLEKDFNSEAIENFDGFTDKECIHIYELLADKLILTIYRKRPANQGIKLKENQEVFKRLSLAYKAKLINEIITMLRCDIATTSDLKLINGSKNAGNMAISKNTIGKSKLILINQSVTGLFENRIEL